MNRQQEIMKQVKEILDELELLGTGKGYELDSPWEKQPEWCRKCYNALHFGVCKHCGPTKYQDRTCL